MTATRMEFSVFRGQNAGAGGTPWSARHSRGRRACPRVTLGILALAVVLARPAGAEPHAPPPAERAPPGGEKPEFAIGVTAGLGRLGIGAPTAGLDLAYRPRRNVAAGVEGQLFFVDNGADPQYCGSCPENGWLLLAFAEGRIASDIPLSAFARFGFGAARVQINHDDAGRPDEHLFQPALFLAVGPELTLFHVFLRVRGTASLLEPEAFLGYGVELGAVF